MWLIKKRISVRSCIVGGHRCKPNLYRHSEWSSSNCILRSNNWHFRYKKRRAWLNCRVYTSREWHRNVMNTKTANFWHLLPFRGQQISTQPSQCSPSVMISFFYLQSSMVMEPTNYVPQTPFHILWLHLWAAWMVNAGWWHPHPIAGSLLLSSLRWSTDPPSWHGTGCMESKGGHKHFIQCLAGLFSLPHCPVNKSVPRVENLNETQGSFWHSHALCSAISLLARHPAAQLDSESLTAVLEKARVVTEVDIFGFPWPVTGKCLTMCCACSSALLLAAWALSEAAKPMGAHILHGIMSSQYKPGGYHCWADRNRQKHSFNLCHLQV